MSSVYCDSCNRTFGDKFAAHQHQRALGHCYCHACERSFRSGTAYDRHQQTKHSLCCPASDCSYIFSSQYSLEVHQRSSGHCFCVRCNKQFGSDHALSQHIRASPAHQATHFYCCDCDREFSSERALEQHLEDKSHAPRNPYQCEPCERTFQSEHALQAHLASPVHQLPGQSIKCAACRKQFPLHSALVQHLESGACKKSQLDRKKINALLARLDTQRLITDGAAYVKSAPAMIMNPDLLAKKLQEIQLTAASNSCCASTHESVATITDGNNTRVTTSFDNPTPTFIYTPTSTSAGSASDDIGLMTPNGPTPISLSGEVNDMDCTTFTPPSPTAMTRAKPQCSLCPLRHFSSQQALQNHLLSAAHDPKYLRCPSLIPGDPGDPHMIRRFSVPSALFQHLEAGVCRSGPQSAEMKEGLKALQECLSRIMQVKGSVKWLTATEV